MISNLSFELHLAPIIDKKMHFNATIAISLFTFWYLIFNKYLGLAIALILDMAFIQIVSKDCDKFLVNRYFLQIYDDMFFNLMIDHQNDDITLIFTEESKTSVEAFLKNVNSKHMNCSNLKYKSDEKSLLLSNKQSKSKIISSGS